MSEHPPKKQTKNESSEGDKSPEAVANEHEQAYNDILNPLHVAQLKDDIETAVGRVGTKSANINKGLDLKSEKKAIREKYIEEYLHIGDPEKTRPIPSELRKELKELLAHNFDELEAMATGNNDQVVDIEDNDTDPEPTPTENEPPVISSEPAPKGDKPPTSPSPKAPDGEPKPSSGKEAIREEIEDIFEKPGNNGEHESIDNEAEAETEELPVTEGVETDEREAIVQNGGNRAVNSETILKEINAADKISNWKTRTKKLAEIAKTYNGILDKNGHDLGIESASRLRNSKARSFFNPRRYTLMLGSATRKHNAVLAEMAKSGPNGSNIEAAKAMKRNWDPRYRKIVPSKNKTLYEVSAIYEKQMRDIPKEIEKLKKTLEKLLEKIDKDQNDQKNIKELREEIASKTKSYNYAAEASTKIDGAFDPLYMHYHKYLGESVANRGAMREDLNILTPLNVFGNKLKRQRAVSKIIKFRYENSFDELGNKLTKEQINEKKARLIDLAKKEIKNRKIRDEIMKSLI